MADDLFTTASGHSKLFLPSYCVINEVVKQFSAAAVEDDNKLERGIIQSELRRMKIQKSIKELNLQDDIGLDETMLDPGRQKKILDDVKSGKQMRSRSMSASENAYPHLSSVSSSSRFKLSRGESVPINTHYKCNSYHTLHRHDSSAEVIQFSSPQHPTSYLSPSNSAATSHDHQPSSHQHFPSHQHYSLTDSKAGMHKAVSLASNTIPAVSSLDTVISVADQVTVSYDKLPPAVDGLVAEVGSRVQYGDPPLYGVVRWIGVLNNDSMAGVELVSDSGVVM